MSTHESAPKLEQLHAMLAATVDEFLGRYEEIERKTGKGAAQALAVLSLEHLNAQAQTMRTEWNRVTGENDLPRDVRKSLNEYREILREMSTHAESLDRMRQRTGKDWLGAYAGPRKGRAVRTEQQQAKTEADRPVIHRRYKELKEQHPKWSGDQIDKKIAAEIGCKKGRIYKIRTGKQ